MNLKLHHVNILTSDVEGSIAFYRDKLGMCLAARMYQEGLYDIAFLRDGPASVEFAIELVGPPFVGWMAEMFEKHGPLMDHFSFVTDDVDGWYEKLQASEVEFLMPPTPYLTVKEMYFRDACGAIVEVMEFLDPNLAVSMPQVSPSSGLEYRLHHISIVCHDIPALEHFYAQELELTTIYEDREDGYIFMADPAVLLAGGDNIAPTIEIMGPPGIEPREEAFLAKYGPGIDHLCFTVNDVDAAYENLSAEGVHFDMEPADNWGTRVAFFKDPNGIDVELILPVSPGVIESK